MVNIMVMNDEEYEEKDERRDIEIHENNKIIPNKL